MKKLISIISEADTAYYKHDAPIMPDREYDKYYDGLAALEKETGIILSGSPTQKVSGEILESLAQVTHTKPMLSAEKTKSIADLVKFINGKAVVAMWKLDGLTLVLRYENGQLIQAITRGAEGRVGEDVTHTVKVFMNVLLEIPCLDSFEVRGEGVISWENFDKLNQETDDEPYAHPRNLAAGAAEKTLNLLRNGIFSALYAAYDPEKEFMPQFARNYDNIMSWKQRLKKITKRSENHGPELRREKQIANHQERREKLFCRIKKRCV